MTGGLVQEVEDLTAETFFRTWKKRAQFRGSEQAALGWLLTIARNLVFDTHRRKKAHPEINLEENLNDQLSYAHISLDANAALAGKRFRI